MTPTLDFLHAANKRIQVTLEKVRPKLLEAQGNIEHRLKDDTTVVTEMDTFVEAELQEALTEVDASIPFSGEETGVDFSKETFWLADPIDGTEQFIRGIPMATNMIALIENGEPVMGVVYNFELGDYYVAIKGHGATCNGHPIHVSSRKPDRAWVTFSAVQKNFADALDSVVHRVRRFGVAGYDYTLVANGSIEGRIMFNGHGKEWDFAPTTLLVQEAGGRVANIGSGAYDYRELNHIAANPYVFEALVKFMNGVVSDA